MADAQRGLDPLNISIDRLLTVSAAFRPDALFLADPSDKDAICGVQAGTITIGEADKKVTEIARFLTTIGLRAGDAVLLRMPNTVEAYNSGHLAGGAHLMRAPPRLPVQGMARTAGAYRAESPYHLWTDRR